MTLRAEMGLFRLAVASTYCYMRGCVLSKKGSDRNYSGGLYNNILLKHYKEIIRDCKAAYA
jgi:hypothetical protein